LTCDQRFGSGPRHSPNSQVYANSTGWRLYGRCCPTSREDADTLHRQLLGPSHRPEHGNVQGRCHEWRGRTRGRRSTGSSKVPGCTRCTTSCTAPALLRVPYMTCIGQARQGTSGRYPTRSRWTGLDLLDRLSRFPQRPGCMPLGRQWFWITWGLIRSLPVCSRHTQRGRSQVPSGILAPWTSPGLGYSSGRQVQASAICACYAGSCI
jgi:hypothetical protein